MTDTGSVDAALPDAALPDAAMTEGEEPDVSISQAARVFFLHTTGSDLEVAQSPTLEAAQVVLDGWELDLAKVQKWIRTITESDQQSMLAHMLTVAERGHANALAAVAAATVRQQEEADAAALAVDPAAAQAVRAAAIAAAQAARAAAIEARAAREAARAPAQAVALRLPQSEAEGKAWLSSWIIFLLRMHKHSVEDQDQAANPVSDDDSDVVQANLLRDECLNNFNIPQEVLLATGCTGDIVANMVSQILQFQGKDLMMLTELWEKHHQLIDEMWKAATFTATFTVGDSVDPSSDDLQAVHHDFSTDQSADRLRQALVEANASLSCLTFSKKLQKAMSKKKVKTEMRLSFSPIPLSTMLNIETIAELISKVFEEFWDCAEMQQTREQARQETTRLHTEYLDSTSKQRFNEHGKPIQTCQSCQVDFAVDCVSKGTGETLCSTCDDQKKKDYLAFDRQFREERDARRHDKQSEKLAATVQQDPVSDDEKPLFLLRGRQRLMQQAAPVSDDSDDDVPLAARKGRVQRKEGDAAPVSTKLVPGAPMQSDAKSDAKSAEPDAPESDKGIPSALDLVPGHLAKMILPKRTRGGASGPSGGYSEDMDITKALRLAEVMKQLLSFCTQLSDGMEDSGLHEWAFYDLLLSDVLDLPIPLSVIAHFSNIECDDFPNGMTFNAIFAPFAEHHSGAERSILKDLWQRIVTNVFPTTAMEFDWKDDEDDEADAAAHDDGAAQSGKQAGKKRKLGSNAAECDTEPAKKRKATGKGKQRADTQRETKSCAECNNTTAHFAKCSVCTRSFCFECGNLRTAAVNFCCADCVAVLVQNAAFAQQERQGGPSRQGGSSKV